MQKKIEKKSEKLSNKDIENNFDYAPTYDEIPLGGNYEIERTNK